MAENPIGSALAGLGRSFRDTLQFEAQARQQQLRGRQIEAQERRALEGLRLQGERDIATSELAGARELRAQREGERGFDLRQRQLEQQQTQFDATLEQRGAHFDATLAQRGAEFEQTQALNEDRLEVDRERMRNEFKNFQTMQGLRTKEVDALLKLRDMQGQVQQGILSEQEFNTRMREQKVPASLLPRMIGLTGDPKDAERAAILLDSMKDAGFIDEDSDINLGMASNAFAKMQDIRKALGIRAPVTQAMISGAAFEAWKALPDELRDPARLPEMTEMMRRIMTSETGARDELLRVTQRRLSGVALEELMAQRGITDLRSTTPEIRAELAAESKRMGEERARQSLQLPPAQPAAAPAAPAANLQSLQLTVAGREDSTRILTRQLMRATSGDRELMLEVSSALKRAALALSAPRTARGTSRQGSPERAAQILRDAGLDDQTIESLIRSNRLQELADTFTEQIPTRSSRGTLINR